LIFVVSVVSKCEAATRAYFEWPRGRVWKRMTTPQLSICHFYTKCGQGNSVCVCVCVCICMRVMCVYQCICGRHHKWNGLPHI